MSNCYASEGKSTFTLRMTLNVTCIHVKHGRYDHIEGATINLLSIKRSAWLS